MRHSFSRTFHVRRSNCSVFLTVCFAFAACFAAQKSAADEPAVARKKSAIPIALDTTFFLGPIDADGYVDFAAALDAHVRGRTTPADNALVGLWQGYGNFDSTSLPSPEYFAALGIAPHDSDLGAPIPEFEFVKAYDFAMHDELWRGFSDAEQRIWTAREFPVVFDWLQRNEVSLDRIVSASRKPRFYRPIIRRAGDDEFILALMAHEMSTFRAVSRDLSKRIHYRLGARRFADAWQDLLALRRLARLIASSPVLLDVLVAYSLDADAHRGTSTFIEAADFSPAELRQCLRDLKELPPLSSQADAIDFGERAYMLDTLQQTSLGNYAALDALEGPLTDADRRHIARNDFVQVMRAANRHFDRIAAALRLPEPAARMAELRRVDVDCKRLGEKFAKRPAADGRRIDRLRDGELSDYLLSDSDILTPLFYRSHDEREQQFALAKLGIALAAFRGEHGRLPQSLDELRPAYFTTLPGDNFSGGAVRYRPNDDGFLLYSVGLNARDDRGENNRQDRDEPEVQTDDLTLRIRFHGE